MMAKVLLLDDSRAALDAGKRVLQLAGFDVILHQKGFGALSVILREQPNVVMLDVTNPNVQGPALCKMIQDEKDKQGGLPAVSVLLHSSLSDSELRQRTEECGADGYIGKGWSWEQKISVLNEHLTRSQPTSVG
jgi:DNA-binding response OmpR family regulator